jgi:hypothetical protein
MLYSFFSLAPKAPQTQEIMHQIKAVGSIALCQEKRTERPATRKASAAEEKSFATDLVGS